jgi:LDH2 family malate/lactate/ureidoglycolate dehydrogenase
MPRFSADTLGTFAQQILQAVGTPPDLAQIVSEGLVCANLVGHDSHGVLRLNQYVRAVQQGKIQPDARASVATQQHAVATVDAARGWGQPAARLATHTALALASAYGIGAVTINRCNHIGRLGEYVETIAQAGMIGMALCNAAPCVAPYGGYQPRMGTNPIAWAVPRGGDQPPLVVDFATAAVAEGKVRVARAKGEQLPTGIVVDSNGRASQDPAALYANGALLPFGGHKGYGISVMIELLGGALSGNGAAMTAGYTGGNGTLVIAFNIPSFVPGEQFLDQTNAFCAQIKASPVAEGFTEIMLPGEPERQAHRQRSLEGIAVPDSTWADLQALAHELHVMM